MENKYNYLNIGSACYSGEINNYVDFIMEHQLLKTDVWCKFVEVYESFPDSENNGWRNEYWGKMMRGACLTYMYNKSEELYSVLEKAVVEMLKRQRDNGSFTTYDNEHVFTKWDMWGRKYIMTGFMHFYRICKDEDLKSRIIEALIKHADCIMESVGDNEGQIGIAFTSDYWEGVNSCSILEPFIDLYKLTNEDRFLEFGKYIISTGGCQKGDLVKLAYEDNIKPYLYPEVKAYETISFFEGVLAYYEVTGEEYYFEAVKKFIEAVYETDMSVIGCAGSDHENFSNSSVMQINYNENIMQETCVTVTLIRVMARLHMLTGDVKYYNRLEQSVLNALYGAVNNNMLQQYERYSNAFVDPLPFDSYSPLYNWHRGNGVGGYQLFASGGYYGCCACIGAAGIALAPLMSVLKYNDGYVFNSFNNGKITTEKATFDIESNYPTEFSIKMKITNITDNNFTLKIRLPEYVKDCNITVNNKYLRYTTENGYITLSNNWEENDVVKVCAITLLKVHTIGDKSYFTYGPLTLASDEQKDLSEKDYFDAIDVTANPLNYDILKAEEDENIRILLHENNQKSVLLTNYSSCGKRWDKFKNKITVFYSII